MEGFLEVGLEMGLKGLMEFDWMENLGEEEQKGLLFPVEEKIPVEIQCMVCWAGQNQTQVENWRED